MKIYSWSIACKLLEALQELGEIPIEAFLNSHPRGRVAREVLHWLETLPNERQKPNISVTLSRLRRAGLVRRKGPSRFGRWLITTAGIRRLERVTPKDALRRDGVRRLVIFDIPEQEKAKRDAIRRELISAGYHQLQKSVWIGDFPLPSDFIESIHALNLRKRVHVLSIREAGTIDLK